jgi:hypothetical protein
VAEGRRGVNSSTYESETVTWAVTSDGRLAQIRADFMSDLTLTLEQVACLQIALSGMESKMVSSTTKQ